MKRKRADLRKILADPDLRRDLMVSTIRATQAREGIDTTEEEAGRAYYVVNETERVAFFDLAAELSAEDLHQNRDPALDAILALEPGAAIPSLIELLQGAYQRGGIEAAVESYKAYRSDPAHRFVNTERLMNEAGYFLLGEGLVPEAIEIFRLNVEAYPQSGNVYDSLGEAYMEAGEKELAIENYEKALKIDPNNSNAVRMLARLTNPE